MTTPQWIKKLSGHSGELYVAAELSKRGIANSLLPENFSEDDILFGQKTINKIGFIQVKSCHPDRADNIRLDKKHELWINSKENEFVVFVWLGSPKKNESPLYWIASKKEVGKLCIAHHAHNSLTNNERRFALPIQGRKIKTGWNYLPNEWLNRWEIIEKFLKIK